MVHFGYPYNDLVICKDSTDYLEILVNKIQFSDVFFSDVFSFNTWHCDIYLDSVHFIICNGIINNNSDQILWIQ